MNALVPFLADNKVYLLIGDENCVQAFKSERKALDCFEDSYNRSHSRGYEASISACLNAITYEPTIHSWQHEDLQPLIDMDIINQETFRAYSMHHVSGSIKGALLTGDNALKWHEGGIKPRLI